MSFALSNESVKVTPAELRSDAEFDARTATLPAGIPRWADVTIAVIGLVILSPVFALTALAIVVSSGFPVIFRQQRVGRGGRLFYLYKLRTMTPNAQAVQVTARGDQRITPLGRFLRRSKLDEWPTLWNVVRGDMALVGPRPEVPRYVKLSDPQWQMILQVRPGITDPVTLQLRNEEDLLAQAGTDPEEFYLNELQPSKLNGYVAYLQQRSCRRDLQMLWRTLVTVATKNSVGA